MPHTDPISHVLFSLLYTLSRQVVNLLQNVKNRARTPRLRRARVITEFPVLVRQFGQSAPRVIANVSPRRTKDAINMV